MVTDISEDTRPELGKLYRLPALLREGDSKGSSDEGVSEVTIYSGDESGVRSPVELAADGLQFDTYAKNPVVMWAHDSHGDTPSAGLPIGRTISIERTGDLFRAKFQWSTDPFAQRVRAQWDAGFLRAASVGFWPLELEEPESDEKWVRVTKADLLEFSIVSIPADPKALRGADLAHAWDLAQYAGMLKARGAAPDPDPQPTQVWVMDSPTPAPVVAPDPEPDPPPTPPGIDFSETERLISQLREIVEADQRE